MRSTTGALIATLTASFFTSQGCQSTGPRTSEPTAAPVDTSRGETKTTSSKVRCAGINECSGKGGCASAGNSCAGKNQCKGKGWIELEGDDLACTDKGGTLVKGDPMKGG